MGHLSGRSTFFTGAVLCQSKPGKADHLITACIKEQEKQEATGNYALPIFGQSCRQVSAIWSVGGRFSC
jgi:hypothetical protein